MNNKYIDKKTFEIVDNVFEVDEDIADTISILNKRGYYTKFCCSGHIKDPRIYEIYENESILENKDNKIGYMVNIKENTCDILMPYTETLIYIMFDKDYNFKTLPNGFKKEENTIEKFINYYDVDKRKKSNDIDKEIKEANKILYEWAYKLPDLKNKE